MGRAWGAYDGMRRWGCEAPLVLLYSIVEGQQAVEESRSVIFDDSGNVEGNSEFCFHYIHDFSRNKGRSG